MSFDRKKLIRETLVDLYKKEGDLQRVVHQYKEIIMHYNEELVVLRDGVSYYTRESNQIESSNMDFTCDNNYIYQIRMLHMDDKVNEYTKRIKDVYYYIDKYKLETETYEKQWADVVLNIYKYEDELKEINR